MSKQAVVVVGSANMDMVVTVDRYPLPGETIFGKTFGMFPGGKGANQAVAAAKLGGRVTFLGKMGHDVFCEQLTRSMTKDGVDLSHLLGDPKISTGLALIMVSRGGQNEIVVVSGSNMKLTSGDVEQSQAVFASAGVTLLQLEIPLPTVIRAAQIAHEYHHRIILNPAPARKLPRSLLRLVDYLTPNETETELLTGIRVNGIVPAERAARRLLAMGVGAVIVTLGQKGCLLVSPECVRRFPSVPVKAIDTTAAGDAFNGALACALAEGKEIGEAIEFAAAVAAFAVTKMGAQSSMPSRPELRRFLSERKGL